MDEDPGLWLRFTVENRGHGFIRRDLPASSPHWQLHGRGINYENKSSLVPRDGLSIYREHTGYVAVSSDEFLSLPPLPIIGRRNRLFAFIYRIIQFPELARNYGGELYTRYCSPTNPPFTELFTGNLINSPPLSPPLEERTSLLVPISFTPCHRMNLCSFNRNIYIRSRSRWLEIFPSWYGRRR